MASRHWAGVETRLFLAGIAPGPPRTSDKLDKKGLSLGLSVFMPPSPLLETGPFLAHFHFPCSNKGRARELKRIEKIALSKQDACLLTY